MSHEQQGMSAMASLNTLKDTRPVLPPGTLLQLMYLKERLQTMPPGRFVEIGPGAGEITKLLLDSGWTGCSYDLEARTISALKERFGKEIAAQRFAAINQDYVASETDEPVDLVISCMVMEHLDNAQESAFMQQSRARLAKGGRMIGLVPASPRHWGIEDDIAGHCRRYTRPSLHDLAAGTGWTLHHMAGLTFPVSNWLLPVSNYLVNRSERQKLSMSALERTKQSGRRQVRYKTTFPNVLRWLLNEHTMYPLFQLQKLFSGSERALVLYFEAAPAVEKESA
ncbi:class I SAM-dependent methyltransferase [Cupriavidus sp. RAF12]|uniref:class I SAM-dependent methyltransferase n=1 Tax=Cupriavidus sp. RAF12 TaxID=3233050 RepID=UPI003F91B12E